LPGRRKSGTRWRTKFGRWVAEYGVREIVDGLSDDADLRVTKHAVYEWLRGHAPRPARAAALVRLSGGRISLEDIYRHVRLVRRREAAERSAGACN